LVSVAEVFRATVRNLHWLKREQVGFKGGCQIGTVTL